MASPPPLAGCLPLSGAGCACAAGLQWSPSLQQCVTATAHGASQGAASWFESSVVPAVSEPPLAVRNPGAEAAVLQVTLTLTMLWLALTLALRHAPLRGKWLRLRFILSRCDLLFHSHHWVDPQKVMVKRRTELGGACTIAVWILFIGFAVGTLYEQVAVNSPITKSVRDTSFADLQEWGVSLDVKAAAIGPSVSCALLVGASVEGISSSGQASAVTVGASSWACEDVEGGGAEVTFRCTDCELSRRVARVVLRFAGEGVEADSVRWEVCSEAPKGPRTACTRGAQVPPAPMGGVVPTEIVTRLVPEVIFSAGSLSERLYRARLTRVEPRSPSAGAGRGELNVALLIELESDWLVLRTEASASDGFVTFLSKLGGLWTLCLTLFMLLLTQSEVHIHKLRYDDKLLIGLERQRRTIKKWGMIVEKLFHQNFVEKRAKLERQVRRRRESLMGEAMPRQRSPTAQALDVLRSIGTGILGLASPRDNGTPATPSPQREAAGFESIRFELARQEREGYVLRHSRGGTPTSGAPYSTVSAGRTPRGDGSAPGEGLSSSISGTERTPPLPLGERTNLPSVDEVAEAALKALKSPPAAEHGERPPPRPEAYHTPLLAPGGFSPEQVARRRRPTTLEAREMSVLSSQAIAFLSAAERGTSLEALAADGVDVAIDVAPSPPRGMGNEPPPSPPQGDYAAPAELLPSSSARGVEESAAADLYSLAYGGGGGESPFDSLPQPEACASPSMSPLLQRAAAAREGRSSGDHGNAGGNELCSAYEDGGVGTACGAMAMNRQVSMASEFSYETPSPLNGKGGARAPIGGRFEQSALQDAGAGEQEHDGHGKNRQSMISKLVPWVVQPGKRRETIAVTPGNALRGKGEGGATTLRGGETVGQTARKRPPPELIRSIALGNRGFTALLEQAEAAKETASPSKLAETVKTLAEDFGLLQKDVVLQRALMSDIASRLRPHLDLPFYSVAGEIGELGLEEE